MICPVKEKIILGIDPGTNIMGYGVIKVVGTKAEVVTLGVIDMRKFTDPYLKLKHIYERVQGVINSYLPDELAIEAPFFGKNVQSMLKLGRAQGVAIVAALCRDIPVTEYAPLKIKMVTVRQARNRWQTCCDACLKSGKRTSDLLWMPQTPWERHIAIICRWDVLKHIKLIRDGKIL